MDNTEDFSFPFEAYDIQKDFMKTLFKVLEEKKLGIFESPTGTVSFYEILLHIYVIYTFSHLQFGILLC